MCARGDVAAGRKEERHEGKGNRGEIPEGGKAGRGKGLQVRLPRKWRGPGPPGGASRRAHRFCGTEGTGKEADTVTADAHPGTEGAWVQGPGPGQSRGDPGSHRGHPGQRPGQKGRREEYRGNGGREMKFVPHDYQRYCINRLVAEPALGLFLDMGLGKTVITLTAVNDLRYNRFEVRKVLVIAPRKVAEDTWTREQDKWDHLNLQMEKLGELGQGGSCQFMEHGLAYHAPGSGTAEPCCMECGNICGDACQRALAGILQDGTEPEESAPNDQETGTEAGNTGKEPEKSVIDTDSVEVPEAAPEPPAAYDRRKLEEMIRKAEEMMKTVEAHRDEVGPDFYTKHAMQLEAYRNLLEAYEGQEAAGREPEEETVPVQPELPVLKNNDQRKAWLRNYRDWGLWYEDRNIGAKYYRYIFGNGAVLIVDEYQHDRDGIVPEYTSSFLHLVGGPKPGMNQPNGCSMWPYHKRYCRHSDSESDLVEFLKALQRKGEQKR